MFEKMDYKICRVCLNSTVTLVEIFSKRQQFDPDNPEPCLADMLNEIAVCHVKADDDLSRHICLSCVLGAQNAWRFKRKCEAAYQQLLTIKMEQEQQQQTVVKAEIVCEESVNIGSKTESVANENQVQVDNLKPFKCPICSKAFADVTILRVHKRWHADIKRKTQASLTKKVTRKANQKQQQQQKKTIQEKIAPKKVAKNTSSRPFPCTECPQGFHSNLHLVRHMRLHTGECPYQCPYCPDAFYRSDYRNLHIKKMHKDSELPPGLKRGRRPKS